MVHQANSTIPPDLQPPLHPKSGQFTKRNLQVRISAICLHFQLFIYIFSDELALVDAAFAYNCKLIKRSPQSVVVSLPGEGLIEFEVLHVLPFDSDRKRMSIILRHQLTRERILFCKGADSAIFPRLEPAEAGSEEEALLDKTQQHLNMYAKEGLRVLVMAKRILSDNEYEEWLILHETAEVKSAKLFRTCISYYFSTLSELGKYAIQVCKIS